MENVFSNVSKEKLLLTLDSYLNKNDCASAEKYLKERMNEAEKNADTPILFLVFNELMGLYRKLGRKDDALYFVNLTLELIEREKLDGSVGAATALLNCATVHKAFSMPESSIALFERAKKIYEAELDENDERFGGLYNNMALTLVDLERFREAEALYEKALELAKSTKQGELSSAMTYLNMASAAECELGLCDADEKIQLFLKKAEEMLEKYKIRDGYYAFVCDKCASVFLYYGHFLYANELKRRSETIYKRGNGEE